VTATGGPGSSGIAVADQYMSAMSSEITDHYDLVFIDQRGIGLSHPFRCDRAVDRDDLPAVDASSGVAARDRFAAAATAFVADCFREARVDAADAGRYATRQAAEDLEAVRRWLGAGRLDLYGESYGTQLLGRLGPDHPRLRRRRHGPLQHRRRRRAHRAAAPLRLDPGRSGGRHAARHGRRPGATSPLAHAAVRPVVGVP
jgi:pimeloyl-ACP methyl ester carboxylesterase